MNIIVNTNFNAIDRMNVLTSAQDIKKVTDTELKVIGVLIYDSTDKATGEYKQVGAVKTTDGTIYGFTSATLIECATMLNAAFEDDANTITITPITGTSKAGRTFYQFKVLNIE